MIRGGYKSLGVMGLIQDKGLEKNEPRALYPLCCVGAARNLSLLFRSGTSPYPWIVGGSLARFSFF